MSPVVSLTNMTEPPGARRGRGPVSRPVAVKVTGLPTMDGSFDDRRTTVELRVPLLKIRTTTVSTLVPLLPSPWYSARTWWLPAGPPRWWVRLAFPPASRSAVSTAW